MTGQYIGKGWRVALFARRARAHYMTQGGVALCGMWVGTSAIPASEKHPHCARCTSRLREQRERMAEQ